MDPKLIGFDTPTNEICYIFCEAQVFYVYESV